MGTNSVTLDANAASDQTAGTLAVSNPVFKAVASLAA